MDIFDVSDHLLCMGPAGLPSMGGEKPLLRRLAQTQGVATQPKQNLPPKKVVFTPPQG